MIATAILVCGVESFFDDDIADACIRCLRKVYVRPYVAHIRFRLCGDCARPMMYAYGLPTNVEIPPLSLREVLEENKLSP